MTALAFLTVFLAVIVLAELARTRTRLHALESRLGALEARPDSSPAGQAGFPPCRLTLQDPGPDPGAIAAILADRVGMTLPSARALVGLGRTEVPIPALDPREAYALRNALSGAGAIVSLYLKPPVEPEPHPTRPDRG